MLTHIIKKLIEAVGLRLIIIFEKLNSSIKSPGLIFFFLKNRGLNTCRASKKPFKIEMNYKQFKKFFFKIRKTPFHPQWFVYLYNNQLSYDIGKLASGVILDIGCADQYMKNYIVQSESYIGLDYYQTATEWYQTRPNIYADAQNLPFDDNCIDTVLLLDVLEHLSDPIVAVQEIQRVLKNKGLCMITMPFMYPIHDAPLDFQRLTRYGLEKMMTDHGFKVKKITHRGKPLETAALLLNIAITKTVMNWIKFKHPVVVLSPVLLMSIFFINVSCWVFSQLSQDDDLMPHGYCITLEKTI